MKKCVMWLDKNKKWICLFFSIMVILLTVYGYQQGIFTNQEKMEQLLDRCGIFAPMMFILLQAVQVVLPILPGAVGCLYGVVVFGAVQGFFYNYIGICIGSILAFLIARKCGKELVQKVTGGKFYQKYQKYLLKEKQFEKLFALLIFLPVAPDDFLCYLAGVSEMKLRKFTAIILLGKPAAILCYSLGLHEIFKLLLQFTGAAML